MKKDFNIKKQLPNIILAAVFIVGLCIFLYPSVSDIINSWLQSREINKYERLVSELSTEEYDKMIAEAREYNKTLLGNNLTQNIEKSKNTNYKQLLSLDSTGIMGYLYIGKINVRLPIYHGTDAAVLQIGVGHLKGSSLPVGGKNTHCVITGHTGLPSSQLLSDVDQLEKGDVFYIDVLKQTLAYEITDIRSVLPDDTESLNIVEGEDYCTIVTCTPYGINTHRLLVTGKRIAYIDMSQDLTDEVLKIPLRMILLMIWTLLFFIYLFGCYRKNKRIIPNNIKK